MAALGPGAELAAEEAAAAPDLLLILDASNSMWGQIGGEHKIVIARRVLKELLGELPDASEVGLVAYGHRREGDCDDIETLAAIAPLDKAALTAKVEGLKTFELTPGRYRLKVKPVRGEGLSPQELEVTIEAGRTVEQMVECSR